MSTTTEVASPQSASLVLSILQSKAGNRWGRAVEEMKASIEGGQPLGPGSGGDESSPYPFCFPTTNTKANRGVICGHQMQLAPYDRARL